MDKEPDVSTEMEKDPHEIRQDIDETRSSLTEKLETLENQVLGTVQEAKETVQDTIENVKETVQETVQTVKRTFDVHYQVDRHPWGMMGGSFLTGFLIGAVTAPRHHGHRAAGGAGSATFFRASGGHAGNGSMSRPEPVTLAPASQAEPSGGPGFLSGLMQQFGPEIHQVKELAIGAALGLVRDFLKGAVPPTLAGHVEQIIDNATTKMGGRPISGPVVQNDSLEKFRQQAGLPTGSTGATV